jgi:hypothetical protein
MKKKKDLACAVFASAIYIILIWNLIPFVYGIIDDRSMMEIVSGQYLGYPDAHTIFSGYWYSLILTGLYNLLPQVDWYAGLYIFLQGCCMVIVLLRFYGWYTKRNTRLLATGLVYLFFAAFCMQGLVQLSFTTTAAIAGAIVVFWYLTAEEIRWMDILLLFGMGLWTCQVRYDIFYMIVPVCGVVWLFRTFTPEKKNVWHFAVPVAVGGILLLQFAGNAVGYGSEEWKSYEQYNDARSMIYDYPEYALPTYDEAEVFYQSIGIEKKSRARTLMNYNYTADDRITPGFFAEYIQAYEQAFPSATGRLQKIVQSVKAYGKGILSLRFHVKHLLALGLYFLLAVWYLWKKQWLLLGRTVSVVGLQILLWLYLLYAGRIPERVIYSMNLMMIVTVAALGSEVFRGKMFAKKWISTLLVLVILGFGIAGIQNVRTLRQENQETAHQNENIEELKTYCSEHPENFYFNDVTSLAFTTWNVHLWTDEPYGMNYMSLGDWMSFSPIWQEKLAQNGIHSVRDALYESDNVYLICSFDKGIEYLELLYDGVTVTEVDKVAGFGIYKLELL